MTENDATGPRSDASGPTRGHRSHGEQRDGSAGESDTTSRRALLQAVDTGTLVGSVAPSEDRAHADDFATACETLDFDLASPRACCSDEGSHYRQQDPDVYDEVGFQHARNRRDTTRIATRLLDAPATPPRRSGPTRRATRTNMT
ncbi:hypothetical protein [Halomicrobium zhouii]|uniref:hypothetical protein n=1 Tax=Halomicrobium zhouii TaxID=767519 RepID=UPI00116071CF|nr:hypothetical protein [Halomicrobium zhouii]